MGISRAGEDWAVPPDGQSPASAVERFASHVIATLAARKQIPRDNLSEALLLELIEAVVSDNPTAAATLIERLRAQGISVDAMTDLYLPAAARALGEAWERDRADFVDVTIGAMRLQAILRGLCTDDRVTAGGRPVRGSVLLIVPKGEQHTLGAMVLAAQLSRIEVSVCLRIMPTTNELREVLRNRSFDGIMLSVGSRENLDLAGKMIKFLETASDRRIPIIIGGAVLPRCDDLRAITGADLATNDIGLALDACGLAAAPNASAKLGARGR